MLSPEARKCLRKAPRHVVDKVLSWVLSVETKGIREVPLCQGSCRIDSYDNFPGKFRSSFYKIVPIISSWAGGKQMQLLTSKWTWISVIIFVSCKSQIKVGLGKKSEIKEGLAYESDNLFFTLGVESSFDPRFLSGGNVDEFTIMPDLPTGLQLHKSTGSISGVATELADTQSFAVTANGSFGKTTAILNISVIDQPPTVLSYSNNSASYVLGSSIAPLTASYQGGGTTKFSIAPSLPAGLTLDAKTGEISGTPSEVSPPTQFTVTALNSGGSLSTTLSVSVNDVAPSSLTYSQPNLTLQLKDSATPQVPSYLGGGLGVQFSVVPELPLGLTINPTTGVISGTPTQLSPTTTYTIFASNSGGSVETTLSIKVEVEYIDLHSVRYAATNMARATGYGPTVVVGDYIYSFAGSFSASPWLNKYSQRALLSSPTAWTDLGNAIFPEATSWVGGIVIDDYVYVYGGVYGTAGKILRAPVSNPLSWSNTGGSLPGSSAGHLYYLSPTTLYIFTGSTIWTAPRTDAKTVTATGLTAPTTFSHQNMFIHDGYIYILNSYTSNIYRAPETDPTQWMLVTASDLSAADGYVLVKVGRTAYYLGGHNVTYLRSASVDNLANWTESTAVLPRVSWGNSHFKRIGDAVYIFGGCDTHVNAYGHNKITVFDVKKTSVSKPSSINFLDTDADTGQIGGDIVISSSAAPQAGSRYVVHFAQNAGSPIGSAIAEVNASSASVVVHIATNTIVPVGATHLLVYASNSDGTNADGLRLSIAD
jgi:hypothetical protein